MAHSFFARIILRVSRLVVRLLFICLVLAFIGSIVLLALLTCYGEAMAKAWAGGSSVYRATATGSSVYRATATGSSSSKGTRALAANASINGGGAEDDDFFDFEKTEGDKKSTKNKKNKGRKSSRIREAEEESARTSSFEDEEEITTSSFETSETGEDEAGKKIIELTQGLMFSPAPLSWHITNSRIGGAGDVYGAVFDKEYKHYKIPYNAARTVKLGISPKIVIPGLFFEAAYYLGNVSNAASKVRPSIGAGLSYAIAFCGTDKLGNLPLTEHIVPIFVVTQFKPKSFKGAYIKLHSGYVPFAPIGGNYYNRVKKYVKKVHTDGIAGKLGKAETEAVALYNKEYEKSVDAAKVMGSGGFYFGLGAGYEQGLKKGIIGYGILFSTFSQSTLVGFSKHGYLSEFFHLAARIFCISINVYYKLRIFK